MKIKVTQAEAQYYIRDMVNNGVSEVEIVMSPSEIPLFPLLNCIELALKYPHPSEKIQAIKAVREFAEGSGFKLGLYDAKVFVEKINNI